MNMYVFDSARLSEITVQAPHSASLPIYEQLGWEMSPPTLSGPTEQSSERMEPGSVFSHLTQSFPQNEVL